jgi:DNA-binding MarR family transcriptional regulator
VPRSQAPVHEADASQEPAPAALTDQLGFLLKHAYLAYQSIQLPALEPLDLDGRQLAVLMVVKAEGPALQQRLSERMRVDRTTMVALVDALERGGLVERRRDPVDRRGYQVSITKKGAKVLERAREAIRAVEREFLDPLSAEEHRQFRTLLARVAQQGGHSSD